MLLKNLCCGPTATPTNAALRNCVTCARGNGADLGLQRTVRMIVTRVQQSLLHAVYIY